MIFDQEDTRKMLVAVYVMEELADAIEFMPIAPSRDALTAMYGDLCPNGPPPPPTDWKSLAWGMEYAATQSAWLHEQHGREALIAEREYYEQLEREMEDELAANEKERWA